MTQIAKAILRKKSKASSIMRFYFEIYYKATVIKTVWYCHKKKKQTHRSMEQNRDHRNKPIHVVIYNKGAKNIQWKEDSLVNKWC